MVTDSEQKLCVCVLVYCTHILFQWIFTCWKNFLKRFLSSTHTHTRLLLHNAHVEESSFYFQMCFLLLLFLFIYFNKKNRLIGFNVRVMSGKCLSTVNWIQMNEWMNERKCDGRVCVCVLTSRKKFTEFSFFFVWQL
mgnify:CR=1 FL=1